MKKYDDTRIVTFKEDYTIQTKKMGADGKTPAKPARVLYAKGSTHAIHKNVVEQIKEKGAKMTIDGLDVRKAEEKVKTARQKEKAK